MKRNSRIYIAGHRGLVGSALVRQLRAKGYDNLVTMAHTELNLTDQAAVTAFFDNERPEYVFLAAAKVGGILANDTYPADFIRDNLAIQTNVIDAAWKSRVKRLLFLGSSCIYPRDCPQPMSEEHLLVGPLEATNRPYAVAKIAGIEMCWSYNRQHGTQFLAVMPTNLYGPGDNFDLERSHVIPALIRKFHLAKLAGLGAADEIIRNESLYGPIPSSLRQELMDACSRNEVPTVRIWGTGTPRREFLYSQDMADACVFLMGLSNDKFVPLLAQNRNDGTPPLVNVGCGADMTIRGLAELIGAVVGFRGKIAFDTSKPDGTPRKLLNIARLSELGWRSSTSIADGIAEAYAAYLRFGNES